MANNNSPAHDFAPSWLKLPSYENYKPSYNTVNDKSGHASRKDDHRHGYYNRRDANHSHYGYIDSRRNHDGYKNHFVTGDRSDRRNYFQSRHHSIDTEDSAYYGNNHHPLQHRPHSRHDFRDTNYHPKLRTNNTEDSVSDSGYNANKTKPQNPSEDIEAASNNFNQEFPSLPGDSKDVDTATPTVNGGVWENPRNSKVLTLSKNLQLIQRPVKNEAPTERSKSPTGSQNEGRSKSPKLNPHASIVNQANKSSSQNQASSAIYRALVLSKSGQNKKPKSSKLSSVDSASNGTGFSKPLHTSVIPPPPGPKMLKNLVVQAPPPPPTQNMEILVKNPKAGNKSEFLKGLSNEASSKGSEDDSEGPNGSGGSKDKWDSDMHSLKKDEHMNGIDINQLSLDENGESNSALSSSLEAERRLLHEMGWKEEGSDDDTYAPLTEDELKEFQQQFGQKKNGLQRNLQINWSPKRIPPVTNIPPPDNWSSSSESDSDAE